MGKKSFEVSLT